MTVKARLTIAFVALLLVAIASVGWFTISSTRASLVEQIDERLQELMTRRPPRDGNRGADTSGTADTGDDRFRESAEIVYDSDGTILDERPAGFSDDPEPLPDLPPFGSQALQDLADAPIDRPSVDGEPEYRVLVSFPPDGNTRIVATPLTNVDDAVADLLRTFLLVGLGVVIVGGAVTWWLVRRGLRPIDQMITTASAIAAGDLSQRVDHDDGRSELGRLATALDDMLSQLESAFAARAASQQRLEQFVADASHELRTPVAAIRGYAELYRSGGIAPGDALDRAMTRIEGESTRMGALVDDLLLLARLDEQQPLEREPVDLTALASDAVSDLRAVDPDRPVSLEEGTGAVVVTGDERRLRQVLANLLTNARMHTPSGTPVHVGVDRRNGEACLTVRDEGPGIPAADRARVFERFYRADRSRSRERGGSGLGLSIVAAVVGAHGGAVDVASEQGRGTTVTVRLPARSS